MSRPEILIRRATKADLTALGRLGALLMRAHYAFDERRFMSPGPAPEQGYARFLGGQLDDEDVVVLVAELRPETGGGAEGGEVVGYVYAGLEPISWRELRDAAGFVHDVAVDATARRAGVATLLMEAAIAWLRSRGAPRVLLWTAEQNADAQRLFTRLGFRRTMIEMTMEL